eukprot:3001309-Prymnesium_polylepis.1
MGWGEHPGSGLGVNIRAQGLGKVGRGWEWMNLHDEGGFRHERGGARDLLGGEADEQREEEEEDAEEHGEAIVDLVEGVGRVVEGVLDVRVVEERVDAGAGELLVGEVL